MSDELYMSANKEFNSVGTRINWGAILGGALIAIGFYSLLAILGAAVGLSISEKVNPKSLQIGAIVWTLLISASALFVGGLVTSLFITRENKVEAILHGVVMWSVVCFLLLIFGAIGVKTGLNTMSAMAPGISSVSTNQNWEAVARQNGVSPEMVDSWKKQLNDFVNDPQAQERAEKAAWDAATRISWFAFAGTWITLLATAVGSLVGLGPTFRIVPLTTRETNRRLEYSSVP
ncbi:hypothetical protein KIH39_13805 [Telmatocola sphagniphila]|uniref:Uncharacterized protein n=1 Tax=Telmatocola sphagniphila TaxID=1123043 RepID=A0A8E6ES07_9BACT|nr:hypothetical protein [Telmatocola sphagniphila]QVL29944.1 hypothetical protein KIH39_13805 [Telmatocola sphagniphila]